MGDWMPRVAAVAWRTFAGPGGLSSESHDATCDRDIDSYVPTAPPPPLAPLAHHGTRTTAAVTPKSINQQAMEQVWRQAVREHEAEVTRW